MNLILKRFYQAVDLAYPDEVTYYLVLVDDGGREILLPVQKETTETLVKMLYAQEPPKQKPLTFQEDVGYEDDSSEFPPEGLEKVGSEEETNLPDDDRGGDGEGGDLEDLEQEDGVLDVMKQAMAAKMADREAPESEDEVPSL